MMKALVVDASVAIGLLRREPAAGEIAGHLRERVLGGAPLLVPELFWLEVVNVLSARYQYPGEALVEVVYELEQLGIRTAGIGRPSVLATVDAMARTGLTAYDAAYLVLADASDADLLTADANLAVAAGERAVFVGGPRGVSEATARYLAGSSWTNWKGAHAYLAELRASLASAP